MMNEKSQANSSRTLQQRVIVIIGSSKSPSNSKFEKKSGSQSNSVTDCLAEVESIKSMRFLSYFFDRLCA
jgi:nicotinamide mononucleotide adenylyltransferase